MSLINLSEEDWKSWATVAAAHGLMIVGGFALFLLSAGMVLDCALRLDQSIFSIIWMVGAASGATMMFIGVVGDFHSSKLGIFGAAYHHYKNKKKPEQVT